ncbi:porin family protein [Xanthocytophaga agilis]|uniref:Porin family protein n=1 Tax=Xanthocytophaga agilis TaxID=3048010 RepID=A0AAE3QZE9_9BACT|nr:porin family protein [Xanthocytophaga agilis]MDJ1500951.1 porin family protein [Xanthocytophaga agilis]
MKKIHWNKLIILFILSGSCLLTFSTQAQNTKRPSMYSLHLPDYDDKPVHYGFFIAGNVSTLTRRYSSGFVNGNDTIAAINPKWSPSYGLGFIVAYGLDPQFDICLVPAFSYYERRVEYTSTAGNVKELILESGFVELSMLARYKSIRRGNIRMYMVGGIKPAIEVGSNVKSRGSNTLRTQNFDLNIEYGFGADLFYEFFKFTPEIRFSHGITNLLVKDKNIYSRGLSRLGGHSVTLYLYF